MGRRRFGKGSGALFRGLSLASVLGADLLLADYDDGIAVSADNGSGVATFSIKDSGTPANDVSNEDIQDYFTNGTTSPKLCLQDGGTYSWSPHNLFLNSNAPVTQNVTLVVGETYTYSVTGTGSLAGSAGASGTATEGSPVTFVATTTTGTFTVTGSLTTIQINKGPTAQSHFLTAGAVRIGAALDYDIDETAYSILCETTSTNVQPNYDCGTNWDFQFTNGTTATTTAPNGISEATTVSILSSSGQYFQNNTGVPTSQNVVFSVYVKKDPSSTDVLNLGIEQLTGVSTNRLRARLSDGVNTEVASNDVGNGVIDLGDWFRMWIVCSNGTDSTGRFALTLLNAAESAAVSGDFTVWGAQVEAGSYPTSPIPTYGSSVTRDQDEVYIDLDTVSAPDFSTTNTLMVDLKAVTEASGNNDMFGMDAGTTTHSVNFRRQTTPRTNYRVLAGTSAALIISTGSGFLETRRKMAGANAVNDFAASLDGATALTDSTGSMPTGPYTNIGFNCGTKGTSAVGLMVTRIYSAVVLAERLSNAAIESWTT